MKRFLNRATAILLCLVLSCSLLPVTGLAASSHPFQDVPSSHWANSAVAYVYDNNLMNGTGLNTFTPNGTLTRAMFVTILGRMDGVNTASYPGTSFSDVPTGQWYSPYVAWASSQGIVTGTGNGQFSPNTPVTREQMAAMIARYVDASGVSLPDADNPVSSFKDAASVSSWARDGLELMRRTGILSGYSDGTFGPKKTATRAEAATIFMRLCVLLDGGTPEEPSDEGFVYQEDTIVLDGSVKHSESGNTVTFSKSSELQNLKKGDIIVVGTESAYKVVDSSADGNSIQVTYTTPELYEFLESIDVEGEAQMDFSQFVPADGVTVSYNSATSESQIVANLARAFEGVADNGINVELKGSIPMGQGREIEFAVKEAIPSLSYKFDMDFIPSAAFIPNKSVLYINEAYVKIKEELSLSVGLKTNIDSTEKFVKTFKVGSVPAVGQDGIGIVIDLYIALTTEGTFEVQYTLNGVVGCQIKDNKPGAISELKSTQDLRLMGAVKLGPKVSVVADLFNQKFLSFSVDAGARVGGEVIVRESGMTCFEGSANMYLEFTAFDDDLIEKYLHLSETWKIWDENSSPLKEKLHFEMLAGNLKKVDECTYKATDTEENVVMGKVVDSETNQPLSGVRVCLNCIFGAGGEDIGAVCTTGADGTFTLEIPNAATYVTGIHFEKDGYNDYLYPLASAGTSSLDVGTIKLTPKSSDSDNKISKYAMFLSFGAYQDYTENWWCTPSEYALLDIDQDGEEELIIQGKDGLGFYNFAVFTYDNAQRKVVALPVRSGDEFDGQFYTYGGLFYSEKNKALETTPTQPSPSMGGSVYYYGKTGQTLTLAFSLNWGPELGYIKNTPGVGRVSITEQEKDACLQESTEINFQSLPKVSDPFP